MTRKVLFFSLVVLSFSTFLTPLNTHAAEVTCFSGTFERTTGKPTLASASFPGAFSGPAMLKLWNGPDGATKVSSAEITVNGAQVFGASNFNQNVDYLEAVVNLNEGENNTCEALLKSKPGSQITIEVTQEVDAAAARLHRPPGRHCRGHRPRQPDLWCFNRRTSRSCRKWHRISEDQF